VAALLIGGEGYLTVLIDRGLPGIWQAWQGMEETITCDSFLTMLGSTRYAGQPRHGTALAVRCTLVGEWQTYRWSHHQLFPER
jgi:hypothetical protein